MKNILSLVLVCLSVTALSQKEELNLSDAFEVRKVKGKMGLIKSGTNTFEIPPEAAFLHISKFSNLLLKVHGRSIEFYSNASGSLQLVYKALDKAILDVHPNFPLKNESTIDRTLVFRVNDTLFDGRNGRVLNDKDLWFGANSFYGVEVVDNMLFLTDSKPKGNPGTVPLIDKDPNSPNFGENLIVMDATTGTQSFVYEAPNPSESASGIYNCTTNEWKVEPKYFTVSPRFNGGYVLEERVNREESFDDSKFLVFDGNDQLERSEFFNEDVDKNYELLKYFVPHFKCDSIDPFFENEYPNKTDWWSAIRFYSGKKVGVFEWYGDVVIEPQDLLIPLSFVPLGTIGVDQESGQATVFTPFMKESFDFKTGDKLKFACDYGEYPMQNSMALYVQNAEGLTEMFYELQEGKRTAKKVDSSSMQFKSFSDYLAHDAHCIVEYLGDGKLLVNHRQSMDVGSVPLIDEDPNSPRFGEALIVTDVHTGQKSFVYELLVEEVSRSGVFDLNSHTWLIPPKFYSVEEREETFIGYSSGGVWTTDVQTIYDRNGSVISEKEVEKAVIKVD